MRRHRPFAALALLSMLAPAGATADHDEVYRRFDVQLLAHELETATRRLHRRAERSPHRLVAPQEWVLVRLHDLEDRARLFHRAVERRPHRLAHTYRDYLALRASFDRVSEAMPALRAGAGVERSMRRVWRTMEKLDSVYAPVVRDRRQLREAWSWLLRTRPWVRTTD